MHVDAVAISRFKFTFHSGFLSIMFSVPKVQLFLKGPEYFDLELVILEKAKDHRSLPGLFSNFICNSLRARSWGRHHKQLEGRGKKQSHPSSEFIKVGGADEAAAPRHLGLCPCAATAGSVEVGFGRCQKNDQTLQKFPRVPDFVFWIAWPLIDPVSSFRSPQSKYWHHGFEAGMGVLGCRTALSAGPARLPAQPHS